MLTSSCHIKNNLNNNLGVLANKDHNGFNGLDMCKIWSNSKDKNDGSGFVGNDNGKKIERGELNGGGQCHLNVSDSSVVVADMVSHVLDDSDKLNFAYQRSECRSTCSSSNSNSSGISINRRSNSTSSSSNSSSAPDLNNDNYDTKLLVDNEVLEKYDNKVLQHQQYFGTVHSSKNSTTLTNKMFKANHLGVHNNSGTITPNLYNRTCDNLMSEQTDIHKIMAGGNTASGFKCPDREDIHSRFMGHSEEEMKLLLPGLLRKREHSGSSRDSGYSSYFSSSANRSQKSTGSYLDVQTPTINPVDLQFQKMLQPSIQTNEYMTSLAEHSAQGIFFNNQAKFSTTNSFLDQGIKTDLMDSIYTSISKDLNAANDSVFTSIPGQKSLPKISLGNIDESNPWLHMDPNNLNDNGISYDDSYITPTLQQQNNLLHSAQNSIMVNNSIASNSNYYSKLNGMTNIANHPSFGADNGGSNSSSLINSNSNIHSINFSPNNATNVDVNNYNTEPDVKLNQFLPSDPTAQKNFLDNIQLLNQLSSIAPLEDITEPPMTSTVQIPSQSSNGFGYQNTNKNNALSVGNLHHSNFHTNNDVYQYNNNVNHAQINNNAKSASQSFDAQSLSDEQILEIAKALLNSCTSPLDISLSEVQVMLKRAALQDPYAKHWLIRNFGEQNSKFQAHGLNYIDQSELLVFKYLSLCGNNNKLNNETNYQAPFQQQQQQPPALHPQMFSRNNAQVKMPFDLVQKNDVQSNLENLDYLKRMAKPPLNVPSLGSRHDLCTPNLPVNNNPHIFGNSTDNYKITTLSNGGFMTSKNCANFEKLTMHSSKDLPSHIAQHLVNQGHPFNERSQPTDPKTLMQDLTVPVDNNNYAPGNFDLSSKLPSLNVNDLLALQAQHISPELLKAGKTIPELVAAAYQRKIPSELLQQHPSIPNSLHPNYELSGARNKMPSYSSGGRHGIPTEYLRNLPPHELLQYQNSFLPYRQLGSISPIIYSLLQRIEDCYDQFRQVERQRKKTEAELARCFPGRRVSSSNTISLPRLPHNPTRLDRLVLDHMREHARVITLVSKMERLRSTPLQPGIHTSLSVWHSTLTQLTALRHADLTNLLLANNSQQQGTLHSAVALNGPPPPKWERENTFNACAPPQHMKPSSAADGISSRIHNSSDGLEGIVPNHQNSMKDQSPSESKNSVAEDVPPPPEMVSLCTCLSRVVTATRGARTALYCALTLTTLQHMAEEKTDDHVARKISIEADEGKKKFDAESGDKVDDYESDSDDEEQLKEEDQKILDELKKLLVADNDSKEDCNAEPKTNDAANNKKEPNSVDLKDSGKVETTKFTANKQKEDSEKKEQKPRSSSGSKNSKNKEISISTKGNNKQSHSLDTVKKSSTPSPKRYPEYNNMSPRRHNNNLHGRFTGKFMPPPPFIANYRKYYHNLGPPSSLHPPPPHFGGGMQRLGGPPPMHSRRAFYASGLHK